MRLRVEAGTCQQGRKTGLKSGGKDVLTLENDFRILPPINGTSGHTAGRARDGRNHSPRPEVWPKEANTKNHVDGSALESNGHGQLILRTAERRLVDKDVDGTLRDS